jgi:uncharacterized protein
MKYLLDVNVLLAAIWSHHPHHDSAFAWLAGKEVSLCPISELGFLRISSNRKLFNTPMDRVREMLVKFSTERKAERIADDLPALDCSPKTSEQVTDSYLSALAAKHGLKLATFDQGIPSAEVIAG